MGQVIDRLIICSLSTQEVRVTVDSIRAMIDRRDERGNHLLVTAGKVTFREMDGVREIYNLAKEIRPSTEALENAWHLGSSRLLLPLVVDIRDFSPGFVIFNQLDLCFSAPRFAHIFPLLSNTEILMSYVGFFPRDQLELVETLDSCNTFNPSFRSCRIALQK